MCPVIKMLYQNRKWKISFIHERVEYLSRGEMECRIHLIFFYVKNKDHDFLYSITTRAILISTGRFINIYNQYASDNRCLRTEPTPPPLRVFLRSFLNVLTDNFWKVKGGRAVLCFRCV